MKGNYADGSGFRETKQKTLEEIAAAFGDKVVLVSERDLAAEEAVMDAKIDAEEMEIAEPGRK